MIAIIITNEKSTYKHVEKKKPPPMLTFGLFPFIHSFTHSITVVTVCISQRVVMNKRTKKAKRTQTNEMEKST